MSRPPSFLRSLLAAAAVSALLAACRPTPPVDVGGPEQSDLSRPALAVQALAGHMRSGDFAAFARDAVPPELHARLEAAWRAGGTRWPLDELPFSERLPAVLAAMGAPDAEATLMDGFNRQLAGSEREIRAAAATLGLFGVQYVERQGDFSDAERDHYAQLVAAVAQWAARAPLGDRERAAAAIPRLVEAARAAGPATAEGIAAEGMDTSLARIGAFSLEVRAVLAGYGLDLDATFESVEASLQVQQGDRAEVRLRYRLGESQVDTLVPVERIDGRWYVSDYLRHAREAAGPATTAVDPAHDSNGPADAADGDAPAVAPFRAPSAAP